MARNLAALAAGFLFGAGLVTSAMVDPAKVLAFLDFFGAWDPSLAFVMAGAVGVNLIGHRMVVARPKPLFADRFHLPNRNDVDRDLLLGAALFGLGWGLAGLCPGPALAGLAIAPFDAGLFVLFMIFGMAAGRAYLARRAPG